MSVREFSISLPSSIGSIEEFHSNLSELFAKYGLEYDIERVRSYIEETNRNVLVFYDRGQPLQNWLIGIIGKEVHKEMVRNNNWSRLVNDLRKLYAGGLLRVYIASPRLFDTEWYSQFNCNDSESCFRLSRCNRPCVDYMIVNEYCYKLAVFQIVMENGKRVDGRMWVLHMPNWEVSYWFNLYSPRKELFMEKNVRLSIAKIVEDMLLGKEVIVRRDYRIDPRVYDNGDYWFLVIDKEWREKDIGRIVGALLVTAPCGRLIELRNLRFVEAGLYECECPFDIEEIEEIGINCRNTYYK
ncbi:MAG: hypothetical protein QXT86_08780 [Archaeoglobaceae archaeon]